MKIPSIRLVSPLRLPCTLCRQLKRSPTIYNSESDSLDLSNLFATSARPGGPYSNFATNYVTGVVEMVDFKRTCWNIRTVYISPGLMQVRMFYYKNIIQQGHEVLDLKIIYFFMSRYLIVTTEGGRVNNLVSIHAIKILILINVLLIITSRGNDECRMSGTLVPN